MISSLYLHFVRYAIFDLPEILEKNLKLLSMMKFIGDKQVRKNLLPCDGEVFYYPDFFSSEIADDYFKRLLKEVVWKEEAIRIFGKQVLQPRQTAWYGDKDYAYSSIVMPKADWVSVLPEIKAQIETVTECTFNGVLLNHYRDGKDSMGWHRDNEKELGERPVIASVSLGQARRFLLRHRAEPSLKIEILLEHGSLLIMQGLTQQAWEHSLPKTLRVQKPRINLTFRHLI